MLLGYTFYELLCLFFIYSFLGWCVEVVYCGLNDGHFINRGFLNGPICPIYGVGGVTVILCLTPIENDLVLLFIGSAVLTSFLELVTGFALDKIFHARWWDYSDKPFNIGGYICLKFSVYWGLVCIALMKGIHPSIMHLIKHFPRIPGIMFLLISSVVLIADIIITVIIINRLSKRMVLMNEIAERLRSISDNLGEHVYEGAAAIKEKSEKEVAELKQRYAEMIKERHILQQRLVKAFPGLKLHRHNDQLEKLKEKLIKK